MPENQEQYQEHYEILYLVPATYTADELKPITAKVATLIKEASGEITKEQDLGKQKLAYPIKLANHGYYLTYEFNLPKEKLQSLNRSLTLSSDVLRFLVTKKKIKTEEEIKREKELREKLAKKKEKEIEQFQAEKKGTKEKPKKEMGKEKISLEDLDKKLDEILDTKDVL